jgi:c-di-GMP-binding flagellar brake protein YcgR
MTQAAPLRGTKILDLFNGLIEKKVIVSLNVVGSGFDRLTCITGLTADATGHHLLVDPPDDFASAAADNDRWHLRFSFVGPDHVEYRFSTQGGARCRQGLKIPFPDCVERMQRRGDFRVNAGTGAKIYFKLKTIEGVIDLINVSLGGAYGVLVRHNLKFMRGAVLKADQPVQDVRMVFPGDMHQSQNTVFVKQVDVKRIEYDQERRLYRYAFAFQEMESDEKKKLTQIIYILQRSYLQRRK